MPQNPTVVFTEPKKVVIENKPMPKPAAGEVLIRSRRTLISTGTELTILKGEFAKDSAWADYGKFPFVPGYDNVGEITDVGSGVDRALVGSRVAGYGPHAVYSTIPAKQAWPIPDEVADDRAVFFTIAQISFNAVRRGQSAWGESAVVYGLGLLGQIVVRALLFSGVRPVFAVDVVDKRLGLLPRHPGIVPLNPKTSSVKDTVAKLTRGRMADVVYEITGAAALIPGEFEALKRIGRFVVVSSPAAKTLCDFNDCNAYSYTIIGAHISSEAEHETPWNQWSRARNAELYFDMVASGDIEMETLVSHREPYTKAPEIYQSLLADRSQAMGVILKWDK